MQKNSLVGNFSSSLITSSYQALDNTQNSSGIQSLKLSRRVSPQIDKESILARGFMIAPQKNPQNVTHNGSFLSSLSPKSLLTPILIHSSSQQKQLKQIPPNQQENIPPKSIQAKKLSLLVNQIELTEQSTPQRSKGKQDNFFQRKLSSQIGAHSDAVSITSNTPDKRHSLIENEIQGVFQSAKRLSHLQHIQSISNSQYSLQGKRVSTVPDDQVEDKFERLSIKNPGTFGRLNSIEFMQFKRMKSLKPVAQNLSEDSLESISNDNEKELNSVHDSYPQKEQNPQQFQPQRPCSSNRRKLIISKSTNQFDFLTTNLNNTPIDNCTISTVNSNHTIESNIKHTQPNPFQFPQFHTSSPQSIVPSTPPLLPQTPNQKNIQNPSSSTVKFTPTLHKTQSSLVHDGNKSLVAFANILEANQQQQNSAEQIMNKFFPHNVNKLKEDEDQKKKKELARIQKKKRQQQYDHIFKELVNKRKTFSKFAFKSTEKEQNSLILPLVEDLADGEPPGTMFVVDLWSEKNLSMFLGDCKMIKDKLLISKIAAVKNKKGFFLDENKPFLLSKKEEQKLINEIYMSESSKVFSEKYSKQLGRTMKDEIEAGKNPTSQKILSSKKDTKSNNQSYSNILQRVPSSNIIHIPTKSQTSIGKSFNSLSEEENEDDYVEKEDQNETSFVAGVGNHKDNQQKQKINFNQFLIQSQIIKTPSKFFESGKLQKQLNGVHINASKKTGLNMNKLMKINSHMIKDLDYLQEQNDKDYSNLIGKIKHLQDKIVSRKKFNDDRDNFNLNNQ